METTTLELEYSDGTSARWIIPDDHTAENVAMAIAAILGLPDTLT